MWTRTHNYGREQWFPGRLAFGVVGTSGQVPRDTQGRFLRNWPNRIFGPWNDNFYTEKIFRCYSRSVDDSCVPWTNRDQFFRISPNRLFEHLKAYFYTEKKIIHIRLVNNSRVPLLTRDQIFEISRSRIFGSQNVYFGQKFFWNYTQLFLRSDRHHQEWSRSDYS